MGSSRVCSCCGRCGPPLHACRRPAGPLPPPPQRLAPRRSTHQPVAPRWASMAPTKRRMSSMNLSRRRRSMPRHSRRIVSANTRKYSSPASGCIWSSSPASRCASSCCKGGRGAGGGGRVYDGRDARGAWGRWVDSQHRTPCKPTGAVVAGRSPHAHLHGRLVRVPEAVEQSLPDFQHVHLRQVVLVRQKQAERLQAALPGHVVRAPQAFCKLAAPRPVLLGAAGGLLNQGLLPTLLLARGGGRVVCGHVVVAAQKGSAQESREGPGMQLGGPLYYARYNQRPCCVYSRAHHTPPVLRTCAEGCRPREVW